MESTTPFQSVEKGTLKSSPGGTWFKDCTEQRAGHGESSEPPDTPSNPGDCKLGLEPSYAGKAAPLGEGRREALIGELDNSCVVKPPS